MAVLTPDAAARAWLDRLPAAQRLAADAYTDERLQAWIIVGLAAIAVSILIARSRILGRLRKTIERGGPRPWLARAACAAVFALVVAAANTPLDALARWREDQILGPFGGMPTPDFGARLAEAASGILPAVGAAVLLAPLLQWLMRRRPRTWPLLAGGLMTGLILAAGWLPYAMMAGPAMAPLPDGPVRAGLSQLIAETGTPAQQIFVSADPSVDADVTGGFGRAKVVVGPRLSGAPPAEARAYVGHLMGHYAHGDVFSVCLIYGLCTITALLAVQWLFAPASRLIGAHGPMSPADPEGLPVVAVILVAAIGVSTPASASFIRWVNVRADAYSLDHARAPEGLATHLERDWDHESVSPSPLEEAVFYTHPPLYPRLVHAMAWKAAHSRGTAAPFSLY